MMGVVGAQANDIKNLVERVGPRLVCVRLNCIENTVTIRENEITESACDGGTLPNRSSGPGRECLAGAGDSSVNHRAVHTTSPLSELKGSQAIAWNCCLQCKNER
jgi:hypothetical protein